MYMQGTEPRALNMLGEEKLLWYTNLLLVYQTLWPREGEYSSSHRVEPGSAQQQAHQKTEV